MSNRQNKLKLRVAQLDLARQMENLDYIKSFIDFIGRCGYNALGLYLEGRIRTKCFPYPPPNESYTIEEMDTIVKYANTKGIEIIPMFALFGHAELFLKYKEMEQLAELRNGKSGRFNNSKTVFCPSLQETYIFFENYLSEILDVFPSEYLHAGCDEAWDIGICDLCQKREEGHTGILIKHLNDIYQIISGKFNKKMIIWDDLFENYHNALNAIPKDIILCVWQYESIVDLPLAHMSNRRRIDKLEIYDQKGFNYFFAPVVNNYRNVATFSQYALKHNPLGGWLTSWELEQAFMHRSYPIVSFAGKLWTEEYLNDYEKLFRETISEIFDIKDIELVETLKAVYNFDLPHLVNTNFYHGTITEEELVQSSFMKLISINLQKYSSLISSPLARDILESILIGLKLKLQEMKAREIFPKLIDPEISMNEKNEFVMNDISAIINDFLDIKKRRNKEWEKHRSGIYPCKTDTYFAKIIEQILKFKEIKNTGVLNVYFCLSECYSAQTITFYIKYQDYSSWEKVASGIYKQYPLLNPFYIYSFLVSKSKIPEAVRIETFGYGGQGITYFEIKNNQGTFVPYAISNLRGTIESPGYILDNDDKWCYMGEKDTKREFLLPELAKNIHSMDVHMKMQA